MWSIAVGTVWFVEVMIDCTYQCQLYASWRVNRLRNSHQLVIQAHASCTTKPHLLSVVTHFASLQYGFSYFLPVWDSSNSPVCSSHDKIEIFAPQFYSNSLSVDLDHPSFRVSRCAFLPVIPSRKASGILFHIKQALSVRMNGLLCQAFLANAAFPQLSLLGSDLSSCLLMVSCHQPPVHLTSYVIPLWSLWCDHQLSSWIHCS